MAGLAFDSTTATLLFVLGCVMGYQYRRVWKADGPTWKLWVYGLMAAGALLAVSFIPLSAAL
ncbi:hypothetical protein [Nitratireductor pacificus]|uniref:Uncharacterized protein n=1 Tax=Nitratireductor pacificus pht-3B TaxID=391937 RepID=K2MA08_9HYPH|nr:hypothetical protein [Nitratireductor pacificus]EKF17845.1 hypothetical protein NA2_16383 [Nitratireductor pacificus pht-3B]